MPHERLRLCGVCDEYVRQSEHRAAHDPKMCVECGDVLPLDQFDEHQSAVDGFRRACRSCVRAGTTTSHTRAPRRKPGQGAIPSRSALVPSQAPAPQERSAIYMLIGTLVHRAVLWPMSQPLTGRQLDVLKSATFLTERADAGCATIQRVLQPLVNGGTEADFDLALGLVNLEGPWRIGSFGQLWTSLSSAGRAEVLRDLNRITEAAATGVSNFIRSVGITSGFTTCAWSEVPLFAIDGFFKPEGSEDLRLRADLVIWRERGDIDVLDLKVGRTDPPDWVRKANGDQMSAYVAAVRERVKSGQRVRGHVLYVGRGAGRDRFRLERVNSSTLASDN
jgi:hypothetical protein